MCLLDMNMPIPTIGKTKQKREVSLESCQQVERDKEKERESDRQNGWKHERDEA